MRSCVHGGRKIKVIVILLSLIILCLANECPAQQMDSPELQITSPADGTVANLGQSISIIVTPAPGQTLTNVSIAGEPPFGPTPLISTPPYQFSITVSSGAAIRKYNLTAWAIDGQDQTVVSVPITISVESPVNPTSISPQSPKIYFSAQGQQLGLAITAKFSDGSSADVTESSKILYASLNSNVVTVDAFGVMTAVGAGSTSVVVTYGQVPSAIQTSILVTVAPPAMTVSPTALNFSSQPVGTSSGAQQLTLRNVSNGALTIISVGTIGDFSETDNCAASSPMAVQGVCTVDVAFAPTRIGLRTGFLTIANSITMGSTSVSLNGMGIVGPTKIALVSSLDPEVGGQSVTFTATVTSNVGAGPTGTVTFFNGTTSLGAAVLNGIGVATYATTALAVGSESITADYGGDTNYSPSTSPPVTEMVNMAGFGPFSTVPPITAGQSAVINLTLYVASGSNLSFTLACVGTPLKSSCSFSPSPTTGSPPPNGTAIQLTFSTANSGLPAAPSDRGPWPVAAFGIFAVLVTLCMAGIYQLRHAPRRRLAFGMCLAVFALASVLISCGGSTYSPTPPYTGTPKGPATFTVTGVSGTTTISTPVSVTVQ